MKNHHKYTREKLKQLAEMEENRNGSDSCIRGCNFIHLLSFLLFLQFRSRDFFLALGRGGKRRAFAYPATKPGKSPWARGCDFSTSGKNFSPFLGCQLSFADLRFHCYELRPAGIIIVSPIGVSQGFWSHLRF